MYVCDPHFGAVQHIAAIHLLRSRLHAHHVGARGVLGHSQGADVLAGDEAGQEALFLVLVAVEGELVDAELGVGGVREADTCLWRVSRRGDDGMEWGVPDALLNSSRTTQWAW